MQKCTCTFISEWVDLTSRTNVYYINIRNWYNVSLKTVILFLYPSDFVFLVYLLQYCLPFNIFQMLFYYCRDQIMLPLNLHFCVPYES